MTTPPSAEPPGPPPPEVKKAAGNQGGDHNPPRSFGMVLRDSILEGNTFTVTVLALLTA